MNKFNRVVEDVTSLFIDPLDWADLIYGTPQITEETIQDELN
jgi:hypothetical protein